MSKACEYGIKAVVCLAVASERGEKKSVACIANNIDSPEAYTSKILQKLVRADIVTSVKGKNGGFLISQERLKTLILWDVIEVIDGLDITAKCVLGLAKCSDENPCPIHENYKDIRADLIHFLKDTPIELLSSRVKLGEGILKINKNLKTI